MTYTNSGRPPGDDGDREAWTRGEPVPAADPEDGAVSSAVNDSADERESAGQAPCPLPCVEADTSLPMPAASAAGQRSSFKTAATVRADALRMLGCVRLATPSQMARVITADTSDGRSYVRRAMLDLQSLGLAETHGKRGKENIWNLTRRAQRALAKGGELPVRPKAGTGAEAVKAGFGPHAVAVTETILAYGGREHLTSWQVEVNHRIKETGLSFNTDAILLLPTKTSEVRLFEVDNGTMTRARLAKEVWDYERYAGHRVWEGARGTIGTTFPFWQRYRYTRSERFPTLYVVLAGKPEHLLEARLEALAGDVRGITIAVLATTLPRLQRGEPWDELGVDEPHRRRGRYPEPTRR